VAKKLILVTAAFLFVVTIGFELGSANAYAAATKKIDCTKVMSELQGGKKVKDVAKDMSISTSSVYRCRKMAKASTMKKTVSSSSATSSTSTSAPSSAATPSTSKSGY
jgi:hypothetical protein